MLHCRTLLTVLKTGGPPLRAVKNLELALSSQWSFHHEQASCSQLVGSNPPLEWHYVSGFPRFLASGQTATAPLM